MSRPGSPASIRKGRAGHAGLLLAVLALLGQFLIAVPHETEQVVALLRQPPPSSHVLAAASSFHPGHAAGAHDPARCPICQASALARTAVSSAWIANAPGPVAPVERLSQDRCEFEPAAPVDTTAAPRAPPVRPLPA